ncbi:MAG: F0F1 ATP synthase subunit A [Phycisphaerales bacterium]
MFAPVLGAGDNPLGHVLDKPLLAPLPGLEWAGPLLTMHTLTMLIAALLTVVVLLRAAKAIQTGPESIGNERFVTKGKLNQMLEVIVLYLRDNVIYAQLGAGAGRAFAPLLLSIFFFILFNNLLGLVPLLDLQHFFGGLIAGDPHFAVIGGTATGRLAVTAALATVVFIIWQVNGIRSSGVGGWLKHFLGGGPVFLAPIMIPVEIIGMIVKPVALALRLFANMTAGHVLLAVLLGFTAAAPKALGWLLGTPVTVVSVFASVAIMFLELFVAFLQAFIFMFLTTLFIGQLMHHHHDEHGHEEGHGHADEHGHGKAAHA